jgi:membrane associated rhomboid family serine protease
LARPETISFFGLQPANFWHHPWTIITDLFIHGSFGHIIANMVSLYFLGSFLLRLIGERDFILIYFIGGIIGNVFYILWAYTPWGDPYSTVIGASGAIFAIGGALAVMAPKLRVLLFFVFPMPLWAAIILFFVISFLPYIAWQAHLGGLLLGLLAGYRFKKMSY